MISQINGDSNNLTSSDYLIDLYWKDNESPQNFANVSISLLTLCFIPTYNKDSIQLIAIVKKNNGEILKTLEYNESYLTIRQTILILALPFQDLNDKEKIKEKILKSLLNDLAQI
ncbi:hypothetical protein [Leptospira limi]|uniref:Type II toxin-antitoxin system PemK/MazF family toxin n=1 Tax=Leptospira limi TaxID=2950023 RepID=A0ABT3M0G2_9LEPT|nr:hypothetical protein [Leptospira limi]MCW7463127.1 hypothetical protein [Leptospira limi]